MTGQQGSLQLRPHGVLEPDDAGEGGLAGTQAGDQVGRDLGLHASGEVAGREQGAEVAGQVSRDGRGE